MHSTLTKNFFDDLGGILIFTRQNPISRRHEHNLRAKRLVGTSELGAGHTRTHHDEVLGNLVERVQLGPGEDALAVRHRLGEHARPRSRGDQDRVRGECLAAAVGGYVTAIAVCAVVEMIVSGMTP